MASRFDRIAIHNWDGVAVLDLGQIDIWDGADLSLLRETLVDQIERKKQRLIGVNIDWVKYIPSGFFGMLFDWYERGTAIFLYSPQPNVANMVSFKQFFRPPGRRPLHSRRRSTRRGGPRRRSRLERAGRLAGNARRNTRVEHVLARLKITPAFHASVHTLSL